ERMEALLAASHRDSAGEAAVRVPAQPTLGSGPCKVTNLRRSPALLALPAPPSPTLSRRRHEEDSAEAAALVAKVARAEAEARQSRIRQLQQDHAGQGCTDSAASGAEELARQRQALSKRQKESCNV
ncbi:unnamed protein product, partial [Effrenium voratum]